MKKIWILSILFFFSYTLCAQTITISFIAHDSTYRRIKLSKVVIHNITKEWSETVYYPDTCILLTHNVSVHDYATESQFELYNNMPNPFIGSTKFVLQTSENGEVYVSVFDMSGKKIIEKNQHLNAGTHTFGLSLKIPQLYCLCVQSNTDMKTLKILNTGCGENDKLYLMESSETDDFIVPLMEKLQSDKPFNYGDLMEFVGFSVFNETEIEGTPIIQPLANSQTLDFEFNEMLYFQSPIPCPQAPTVIDYDGNVYNTVQIGNQCWMKENLRTTHYSDGSSILLGGTTSNSFPYRYYPNNNINHVTTYGYLYNWSAVMNGEHSSLTNQGICPNGWHVPSVDEWLQLTGFVSSINQYYCGSNSNYIAKSLASSSLWSNSSTGCAIGNLISSNNATGFSAVPSGSYFGSYNYLGNRTSFWTSSQCNSESANYFYFYYDQAFLSLNSCSKYVGASLRCVMD